MKVREERKTFPVGENDDTVDATTQALLWMYMNQSNFLKAMEEAKKNGGLAPKGLPGGDTLGVVGLFA